MRVRSTLLARLLWALALALPTSALSAQAANSPEIALTPQQVSPHGWFFQGDSGAAAQANRGFMSNAGFVVTSDAVVVFDALGTPPLGRAMIAAIRKVTPLPIRRVIVSHYHADHVYGLQEFKREGAEIWAFRKGEVYFTSGQAAERLAQRRADLFPWVDETTRVVRPDLWLDGDTDFRQGGITFRLIWSGGSHSPEDLMMYVVEDRLLFCGDLLFAGRVPFVGNAARSCRRRPRPRRRVARRASRPHHHARISRPSPRSDGPRRCGPRAVRRSLCESRLVALQGAARLRRRQPRQRVRHVPADGAGRTEREQAVSTR
jgi:glyoxylase-like metal-dependent hydrolase (beta-lactamase superfamily II)